MLKWFSIIVLILFLGLCTIAYLYSVDLRTAGIIEGRNDLEVAAKDFAVNGYVTNHGSTGYQVWLSSNIVSIGGAQYQCFITTTNDLFGGEGSLAVTTNQVFIWQDNERPPKIITTNYRAPIFPPHF